MEQELYIVAIDLGGYTAPVLVPYSGIGVPTHDRDHEWESSVRNTLEAEPACC